MARGKGLLPPKIVKLDKMETAYDLEIATVEYFTKKELKEYIRRGLEYVRHDYNTSTFDPVLKSADYVLSKNISEKMSGYNKDRLMNAAKLIRAHMKVNRYVSTPDDFRITTEMLKTINRDAVGYELSASDYRELRKYFGVVRDIVEEYGSMELKNMFTEMKSRDIENPTLAHVTIDVYYKNKGKDLTRDELVKLLKKEILG